MGFLSLELSSVVVFLLLNIFTIQFEIGSVSAAPVIDEVQAMAHLTQFGYIQSSMEEMKTGKRISKKAMSRALKEYQDFNNLEVTGNLDTQTINKMQQPRCGNPDKFSKSLRKKRFVQSEWRWAKKKITYSIDHNHKSNYHLSHYVENHEINRAFKVWEEFISMKIEFSSKFDSDISVSFETKQHGCKSNFDGPYGVLAHAVCPHHPESSRKSFIHFDDEEYWHVDKEKYPLQDSMKGPNFFQVAVHEIGHALGLEHSKDPKAIMRAHFAGEFHPDFKLSLDDVYGIQTLYPKERTVVGTNDEPLHTTVPSRSK